MHYIIYLYIEGKFWILYYIISDQYIETQRTQKASKKEKKKGKQYM